MAKQIKVFLADTTEQQKEINNFMKYKNIISISTVFPNNELTIIVLYDDGIIYQD